MLRTPNRSDHFWALTVLAVLAMALVVLTGLALVHEFDKASKDREELVVDNGIAGRLREVSAAVAPEAVWDDAVAHLENRFDPEWTRQNVGVFFSQTQGFEASFVLDGDDTPIFAFRGATPTDAGEFLRYGDGARALVARVRELEGLRQEKSEVATRTRSLGDVLEASGLVDVEGKLYIVCAAAVQPDFGRVAPQHRKAPIIVAAMRVGDAFLAAFADRFQLTDLRLGSPAAAPRPGMATVALRDFQGHTVGTLQWSPQDPGHAILRRVGVPIVAVVVGLIAIVLFLYRRGRRMAEGLITSEAKATRLAYYDALTELPNRVLFFEHLAGALRGVASGGGPVAVHCLDLDRLKDVNDTYGHQVGDRLLREAAARMAELCRSHGVVARLSGDEFAIIQHGASTLVCGRLATALCTALSEPFDFDCGRVFIGCSIGITIVNDATIEPLGALRQADLALYRAKQNTKGRFAFFDVEMDRSNRSRRGLESDLRYALAAGSIYLHYQPQVNATETVIGVEALARWQHPERGNVPPAVFVDLAEECGLIMDLGLFTLRKAFEDGRRWPRLKVAVNVSAKQLRMRDFVGKVSDILSETGVDPHQFELEITEGILLGDDPETLRMLDQLRDLGFSIALDDFGTGYSSLGYLQRYPIDRIKIDRSFVVGLGVQPESEAVVGAIVMLGRALGLSVIAEGVETAIQQRRLLSIGCANMQGYLFGRPVDAEEIDRIHARQEASRQHAIAEAAAEGPVMRAAF